MNPQADTAFIEDALGTGGGHFVYICNSLDHDAVGLERAGIGVETLHEWMGLNIVYHTIAAKEHLPHFEERFDTVTAWRVPLNKKQDADGNVVLFDLEDWAFFLDDIRDNVLRSGGRLALKMNRQPKQMGLHFGDAELMEYFAARGALPDAQDWHVIFDPLN